jgi:hypothetical protein
MPRQLFVTSKMALAIGVAALGPVVPSWTNSASASAPTGHKAHHTTHHYGPLSGKWSGTYSGSYGGTFALTWQQLGKNLSGTIEVSAFKDAPTAIHGTVQGSSISFGTVGSEAITYSGSVSGNGMSGTWQIQAGGRTMGSGSWTASRVS